MSTNPANSDTISTVAFQGPKRSVFEKVPFRHLMTFNQGELVPILAYPEIYPGDTFSANFACVIRTTTFIKPIMDNLFLDIWVFFVPHRLNWDNFGQMFGENKEGAWANPKTYLTPQFTTATGGVAFGSLANHCGIRAGIAGITFSCWPIRSYVKIYNRFFRNENVIAPLTEYTDDTDRETNNEVTELGGKCAKVAKLHDYFTTALPGPLKSDSGLVPIPLGTSAPVIGTGKALGLTNGTSELSMAGGIGINGENFDRGLGASSVIAPNVGTSVAYATPGNRIATGVSTIAENSGLIADLTNATAASLNALRLAIGTQHILEQSARTGTRQPEIILGHFGVRTSDAVMQYPQYLGGKRIPLVINQVNQTSATTQDSPLADEAGYSLTADSDFLFSHSFQEWGTLMVLGAVRQTHTYQQGVPAILCRREMLSYYWPELAHIGEQPIKRKEIFATGTAEDNNVFGFKEPWDELHYMPHIITGEFNSDYEQSLDVWHLGDDYETAPVLSQEFVEETDVYLKRTLAEQTYNQIRGDFFMEFKMIRPMPTHSVPGLTKI